VYSMQSVGFIGLGAMGNPMAKNMIKAGYSLLVYDVVANQMAELATLGAQKASSPVEVGEKCGTVILMLPNSPHVETVLFGENGLLGGMKPGGIIVDMSTIAPGSAQNFARKAAERQITILDAPVSGGTVGAQAGTLAIMAGGPRETLERVMPILETMGKTIVHVGPSGAGQTFKMVNQIILGISWAAVAEAWTIGVKAGADPALLQQVLNSGAAHSAVIERISSTILASNFEPGFMIDLQHKDLCIAMETSRELNVPLNLASIALQYYEAARALGFGRKDHSGVIKVLEHVTGVNASRKSQA
jgi:2-hydroxy-3-oxopropionate reductase